MCYSMDNVQMKVVDSEKDLGITFDNTLSFEEHIISKVNKANSLVGMLRRSFLHLDKDMFKKIFVAIVRPHIEYGEAVWNPKAKKLISSLEKVQRRASKMVPGLGNLSYEERLRELKLPTLQYRRYRGDMIETYKLAHELYDTSNDFMKFKPSNARGHNLRGHRFMIEKERPDKDIRRCAFKCRVTNQWNNLPEAIVNAPSLNAFKNRLDKLWESENIVFDPDIDIFATTAARRTRFITIPDEEVDERTWC